MADVVVIGGGLSGQSAAMLLGRDGHHVTVLERDPAPPAASPEDAWAAWERRGVNQFRMLHYFLPCWREIVERELRRSRSSSTPTARCAPTRSAACPRR